MTILYVETSAILRLLFQETGHEDTAKRLESADRLIVSRLLKVEVERAIIRAAKMQGQKREAIANSLQAYFRTLWAKFDCVEISREICDLAGQFAPDANLRSLDAVHAATFHWLKIRVPEAKFLSYDQRLINLGF